MTENKIDKRQIQALLGLTAMQEGMLLQYLADPHSKRYFEQIRCTLSGKMDRERFQQAWAFLARENEILRSVIRWKKLDEPVQVIFKQKEIPLRYIDWRGEKEAARAGLLETLLENDRNQPLDLTREPLRLTLVQFTADRSEMILTFHHILWDGWSTGILLKEFLEVYSCLLRGESLRSGKKTRYREFFKWYQDCRKEHDTGQQEFWKKVLEGFDTRTQLPYDSNKLAEIQQVKTYRLEIPPEMENGARAYNVTLSTMLYAAWGILLQKYNNCDDVIFGTTVSGRIPAVKGIEHMVGLFINTLPLRFPFGKNSSLAEVLPALADHLEERNRPHHQHSALTRIKQLSGIGRENNLFDSLMVIDNYPLDNILARQSPGETPAGGLSILSYESVEMTDFDLTLQILLLEKGMIKVDFLYNADLFKPETVQRLAGHYEKILAGISENPSTRIADLAMLSAGEIKQLLEEFNDPGIEFRVEKTIHGVIEEQVARSPDHKAVGFQDQWWTYRQLNEQANRLAYRLKECGAGTGARVAMIFPRSITMIAALLGILKAGAACIPLDIAYPEERNLFIIGDSEARILLTSTPGSFDTSKIPGVLEVVVDPERLGSYPVENPANPVAAEDLSYIIYTSGSTGHPKGALLHHSGVVNHTYTKIRVLGITGGDTVANNFSINVIAAVWQILSPLFMGARLLVYSEEIEWDPYRQFARVEADGITVIEVIPSVLKAYLFILEEGKQRIKLEGLRKIALTTEETKPFLVNKFYRLYDRIDLVDCYGQTECCDDVLHYTIPRDTATRTVPIGTPSLNTNVFILNHHDQLQPVGAAGEICVIGAGVAYGYWKRPEMNAEKFVFLPPAARGAFFEKTAPLDPPKKRFKGELNKNFCGGPGGGFSKKSPLVAEGIKMYRTGDLGRWRTDGKIEYLGRVDYQVKIRGNRVELREIENHMMGHVKIKEAAVVAREDREGDKNLYAFFIAEEEITAAEFRQFLLKTLPDYMVPAHFVRMDKLPLTPNGKIDRKVLMKMEVKTTVASGSEFKPPRSEIEEKIRDLWAQVLESNEKNKIGIQDNFFDLGGHSLLLIRLKSKLEKAFHREINIIDLFNLPTIAHQADFVDENSGRESGGESLSGFSKKAPHAARGAGGEIAVIGISLRVPGAGNLREFWQNLSRGVESISFFREDELEGSSVESYTRGRSRLVPAGGILGDIENFDADFFGFNPREAEIIEPQQRLFLQYAWQALEDAGYGAVGDNHAGAVGIYAGVGLNTYLLNNIMGHPDVVGTLGEFQTMIGNDKDFLATRAAYKFNLKGPAVTLQSACSTSLVALHLARQGLLNGDCDMALVGGVAIHVPERTGYFYNEGGYLSPDGHCRPFAEGAEGTVFGNGIGVVVLKPLETAIRDRDHIYAVVKGSAINNDGSLKVGYTSPGETGQADVILGALQQAGVAPETVGYIETHGTGTVLGDPVEMAALGRAFRGAAGKDDLKKQYCAVGSVKANIGHLDIAAGVTGLIKAVLCLQHRQIPPSLHVTSTNPMIDFPNTPFYLNRDLADWPEPANGIPRRAGVSSFGIGGTNAHIILEEWRGEENDRLSSQDVDREKEKGDNYQLLLLAARSETALQQAAQDLVRSLEQNPALELANVAYTLTLGRKAFDHRLALVSRDRQDAMAALTAFNPKRIVIHPRTPGKKSVIFMFPGVGEHYVNMAYELYREEPVFREAVDRCCEILAPHLDKDLRDLLFVPSSLKDTGETRTGETGSTGVDLRQLLNRTDKPMSEPEKMLSQTLYAQTAVFVVEYALARLLLEWGIEPYAMIGYSTGEYTAACLAGVFSLEDALFLVAHRAKLIHSLQEGAMVAVNLPEAELKQNFLQEIRGGGSISIAAVNTPDLCIVSGDTAGIRELEQELQVRQVVFRRLKTFQAFHSPRMAAVREELSALFSRVKLHPPAIPYISNVTGTWVSAEQVTSRAYWLEHTEGCLRFSAGITELLNTSCNFFLEVGPGNSLSGFVAQHHHARKETAVERFVLTSLPKESENTASDAFFLRALSKLWAAGLEIRWDSFYRHRRGKRVPLPTYPFSGKRYWLDHSPGTPRAAGAETSPGAGTGSTAAGTRQAAMETGGRIAKTANLADWFYLPLWKQSLTLLPGDCQAGPESREHWLLFLDDSEMSRILAEKLTDLHHIALVKEGQHFSRQTEHGREVYRINPGQAEDYLALVQALAQQGKSPDKILHLWQWSSPLAWPDFLDRGVYSLLYLVKAMARLSLFNPVEIWMVSRGLHKIESHDRCHPEKAAILGPCRVISQEYPNLCCRSIDFHEDSSPVYAEQRILQQLLDELKAAPAERVIAYRGMNRWVQSFERLHLEPGPEIPLKLRPQGVYLITGGLGKIGFTIARYLAGAVQARLILTGRSPFPGQEPDNRRLERIKQLEELGAQVLVVQADAADRQQMQQAVQQAETVFGGLHGVLHAAGIMADHAFKLIAEADRRDCQLHFGAKIRGLQVLEEVIREKELDFCLLTSSLSPLLGGLSLFAYSAANSFMDAFAHGQALVQEKPWLSINWADWQPEGAEPLNDNCANLLLGSTVAQLNITTEEGKETFKRVLSLVTNTKPIPEIVVSSGNLHHRLQQWVTPASGTAGSGENSGAADSAAVTLHQRPRLQSIYEPPKDEAEQVVAEIWQQLLGIETVGVHDNFFELGGHSLIATRLISRLREIFRIDIPLPTLFDRPTIRELVENVIQAWGDGETVTEIARTYQEVQAMPESDLKEMN